MSFPESVYTQFFTLNPIFIVSGSSLAFPDKKSQTATPSFPDRRERTSLQNPGEASMEAGCRDHQKSSGASLGTARDHLEAAGDHLGAAGGSWRPEGGRWKPFGSPSGRLFHYLLQIVTSTFKCAHFYMPSCTWHTQILRLSHYLHIKVHFLKTLENISFYMLSCDG